MSEAAWTQLAETIENAVEAIALDQDEIYRAEMTESADPSVYQFTAAVRAIQRALARLDIDDPEVLQAYAPCLADERGDLAAAVAMHARLSELSRVLTGRGLEVPGLAFAIRMHGHYLAELRNS